MKIIFSKTAYSSILVTLTSILVTLTSILVTLIFVRLYDTSGKKDALQLPPSAVTKVLVHAVEAKRPKPRYYVTVPTHIAGLARRLLPTRLLDWVVSQG